ncbi:thymidine kinase, partial [Staphylococcus epidermidis]
MYAKQNVLLFKPPIHHRYHKQNLLSHNPNHIQPINISTPQQILNHILQQLNLIPIHQVQFFQHHIVNIVQK